MSDENLNEENVDLETEACECEEEAAQDVEETTEEANEASSETSEASESKGEEELEKRYMSLYAEYENFRKRTAKEKEDLYASAVASVTKDWLVVLDNINRAIDSTKNADDGNIDKIIQGVELIGNQAADVLKKLGVTEIEAERGVAFDPNLHEAVMHIEDDELGENTIATVFEKGYIYKDRVVRHAVVQVAN